jgi:type I restriction enzyme, S subunit
MSASGWVRTRLKFVASIDPPVSTVRRIDAEESVSFIPMEAVGEDGSLDLSRERPSGVVREGYTAFQDGDVIVAKITPCFENGKGAIVGGLRGGVGFGTTELFVLRPDARMLDGRFLYYLTYSDAFRQPAAAQMYGAGGQKRVPGSFVKDFSFSLPPIAEQRAIANFLDREVAVIDQLLRFKVRLLALIDQERQSLLASELSNESEETQLRRLKHLVLKIIDTEHKTAPFFDGGKYLVVRTPNVRDGRLILDGAKYTDEGGYLEWTRRGRPIAGDILFTREAPAGQACLVPHGLELCLGQRMVLLRVDQRIASPEFVVAALYGSKDARAFIDLLSQGSTVTHFNISDIGNIPLPLPPLTVQRAIVDRLRRRFAVLDQLSKKTAEGMRHVSEYRSALITSAVTGQVGSAGSQTETAGCVGSPVTTSRAVF